MLGWFTSLSDWVTYSLLGLSPDTALAKGLHFFVEDTSKILVLLVVLIYAIAVVRASLNPERVRAFLQGQGRFAGYIMGSTLGAVTPFCSCSSIPLFMGFVSARIPLGVTMAFLLTSPIINEVVIILLGSMLGLKFTILYVSIGLLLGIVGGFLIDQLKAHRWLVPFLAKQYEGADHAEKLEFHAEKMTLRQRHDFAMDEAKTVLLRIWKWVILGVGLGAFIHGFVPEQWFQEHLGDGQWWTVPLSALIAIPMYVNATSIVPVMESLLIKGVPLGTTLAFCMSAVAVSLPEFTMLKQVMQFRLLALIAGYLLVAFCLVGWLFNTINIF
ncbi:permease [Parendozoicomonas haliclonae]|uniref:Putative permease n=1 Tax=Parendozoicomonas haliclonae TaxID=1960125 RepID=A0A1X7AIF3_9GAMM|nr:permease [Parendozoicomonas haliclonae]SMA45124.1 putative permease [Parendozoicomonas haliclonae]